MRRIIILFLVLPLLWGMCFAQDMLVSRSGHVILNVGDLTYAIGGMSADAHAGTPALNWEVLSDGSWTLYPFPDEPVLDDGLWISHGFVVGDDVFIVTQNGLMVKIESSTNEMTVLGTSINAHSHGLFLLDEVNSKIFAIGGMGTLAVDIFDCAAESWSPGPSLPGDYNLENMAGVVRPSGEIVFAGGRRTSPTWETSIRGEIFSLDFGATEWIQIGDLLIARENHTATLLQNGNIVWIAGNILIPAGGGRPPDPPQVVRLASSEVTTGERSQVLLAQVLQQPRVAHVSTREGTSIVVAFGEIVTTEGWGYATIVEIIDPEIVARGLDLSLGEQIAKETVKEFSLVSPDCQKGLVFEFSARASRAYAQTYHTMTIPVGETGMVLVDGVLGTFGGNDNDGNSRNERQAFTPDVPAMGPLGLVLLLAILSGLIIHRRCTF
ncbi:MAG: hypothetical protein JXR76_13545 [Deltaproteobacteria bacterium]|nr:hypothetical protein [Deltaproteobacteria bacterium]